MRMLHKLVGVVLLLLILWGSAWLFLHVVKPEAKWQAFLELYLFQRYLVGSTAAAVFFLAVLYVLTGITHKDEDRFISFSNSDGSVSVSIRGMSAFISKLANEFDAVKGLDARVIPGSKHVDIVLNARISSGVQVHEVCEQLQQRVRLAVKESLGVTEVRHVKVNVREIVGRRIAAPSEQQESLSS